MDYVEFTRDALLKADWEIGNKYRVYSEDKWAFHMHTVVFDDLYQVTVWADADGRNWKFTPVGWKNLNRFYDAVIMALRQSAEFKAIVTELLKYTDLDALEDTTRNC